MPIKMTTILFAFLAYGVLAAWEPPERVDEECETEIKNANIYIDQITRISHYFWCQHDEQSDRFYLYYRKQIPEGILYPETILDITHSCEGVSVTGSNDGRRIYVAYNAERQSARTSCNEDFTDGCMDIYTLQSLDSGETWSIPAVIPRRNLKDVRNRWNPRILINPFTDRIWVFYITQEMDDEMYSIGYTTKPEGSSIYGAEVLMNNRKDLILDVTAAVSNPNSFRINLVWSGDVNGVLTMNQMVSMNNGVSWRSIGSVDRGYPGNMVSNVVMNARFMYIPYLQGMGHPTYLKMSTDGGERWASYQISRRSGSTNIALCFKAFGENGMVFALSNVKLEEGKYNGEFGYFQIGSRRWVQDENPFGQSKLSFDPNIQCYVENGQYIVKAIAISEGNKLYVTKKVF